MCAEQPPPNRNEPLYYSKCLYGDTSNALQLKDCPPLEVVLQRLETAKKHLACGTYYSGTFNIIYELMIKRTDPIVDLRIQELTASVFYEFGEFIRRFTSRDERCLPEVKSYAKELEGFVHNVNEMANGMRGSLRGSWSRVISDAGSLLFNVERLLSSQPFDGPGAGSSGSMVVAATRNKERYSFDAV
ncbi:hypothetical protein AX15_006747 [Amanita polypyramis BW_CC]|nr:hypothetical protein AX15_006747 [Amanita polypyramis BW_CC]